MFPSWVLLVDFWMVRDETTYKLSVQHLRHHQIDYQADYTLLTQLAISVLRVHVPLCMGRSKGKAGLQLECIPEKRDTNKL